MNLIYKESIVIDEITVDICSNGYGELFAVSRETDPRFCISDRDSDRFDLINKAKLAIHAWKTWSEFVGPKPDNDF